MKKKFSLLYICLAISAFTFAFEAKNMSPDINLYLDNNETISLKTSNSFLKITTSKQDEKDNWGFEISSIKLTKKIPIIIKSGNLSLSGILSKMNNPYISNPSSPFSTGISQIKQITANLPGHNSFSNPVTNYISVGYTDKKSMFSEFLLNGYYTQHTEVYGFSAYSEFLFLNKNLRIQNVFCYGNYPYKENKESSWYSKKLFYPEGVHSCSFYQTAITFYDYQILFSTGLYETPFGSVSSLYRIDNIFTGRRFILNFSTLYNPNCNEETIITSSDKKLKDCIQLRWGIQNKYITGLKSPVFIKTAFQNFLDFNLSSNTHSMKFAAGIQFSSSLMSLSISGNISLTDECSVPEIHTINFNSAALSVKNNWNFKYISPSLSVSETVKLSSDNTTFTNTTKVSGTVKFSENPHFSLSGTYSYSEKNMKYNGEKLSASAIINFIWKKLKITGKLSLDTEMQNMSSDS